VQNANRLAQANLRVFLGGLGRTAAIGEGMQLARG
jgi:hypothetical protein